MPPSIFNCETLVSLKLNFEPFASAEFVSLPCLKTLDLEYPNEAIFGRLVSSCPVLEELNIVIFAIVRVLSKSLKSLSICILFSCSAGVVIDAPQLCFFSIKYKLLESFVIVNIDSKAKLYLDVDFQFNFFYKPIFSSDRDRLRSFLPVISNIRDMTVSENTFKLFYQYSKFEPFPQFGNMSRLHVTLCVSNLIWLPNFLESCPNLKSLTMVCSGGYDKINEISFSSVPECFCYRLSSLLS
ncbi:putative F-box/FBD/LRR-repeat protein At5g25850 isoform X2 [Eutrema salsugineum]|nr:putative F-box/FBD/LRR-repeat protein At5g25850 isoform X2 [Eutrema salsugineum]